ncbi:MAG TPA: hypothetical protein VMM38_15225 [Aridibacter sp.]|nr:hypothetical protein [Aridibacter sp.]
MAPLIILLVVFLFAWLIDRFLLKGELGTSLSGRIAMSAMLLVTAIAHFTSTEAMVQMMPDAIPYKRELVWFTGLCELAAVIGLLWNRTIWLASVMLIIFFVAVLPANIFGSLKAEGVGGTEYGPLYLLFRIPLQIFFIAWVWYFGLKKRD